MQHHPGLLGARRDASLPFSLLFKPWDRRGTASTRYQITDPPSPRTHRARVDERHHGGSNLRDEDDQDDGEELERDREVRAGLQHTVEDRVQPGSHARQTPTPRSSASGQEKEQDLSIYRYQETFAFLLGPAAAQEAQDEQDGSDGDEEVAHVNELQHRRGDRTENLHERAPIHGDPDPDAEEGRAAQLQGRGDGRGSLFRTGIRGTLL